MPFGRWRDFAHCLEEMRSRYDEETAKRVCGRLQSELGEGRVKQGDPDRICGELWFNGSEAQRGAFGSGTEGRGRSEKPPKSWWDDCVAHVGKTASLKQEGVGFQTVGEDADRWIIAGYASVDLVDSQGDRLSKEALQKMLRQYLSSGFANINLIHSNATIGRALETYQDKENKTWTSHVDDVGLFLVGEVRKDIDIARKAWMLIKEGKLRAFSIGGQVIKQERECDERGCHNLITDFELWENTVTERGANPAAVFTVVKSELPCLEEKLERLFTVYGVPEVKAKGLAPLATHFLEVLAKKYAHSSTNVDPCDNETVKKWYPPKPTNNKEEKTLAEQPTVTAPAKQEPMVTPHEENPMQMVLEKLAGLEARIAALEQAKATPPMEKAAPPTPTPTESKPTDAPTILTKADIVKAMDEWFTQHGEVKRKSAVPTKPTVNLGSIIDRIEKGEKLDDILTKEAQGT